MKTKMNIKSIIIIALVCVFSMFFINICFAANIGKISSDTVKLRKEPNTDSTVLELVSLGEEVEILGEEDNWYQVEYKEIKGYIRKDLVQIEGESEEANVAVVSETETNSISSNTLENENNSFTNIEIETSDANDSNNENQIDKNKSYKISEDVKIKIIPLINGIEIENINKDSEVEVIEVLNDWVEIKTTDEKIGWIIIDKLVEEQDSVLTTSNQQTNTEIENTSSKEINAETVNVSSETTDNNETIITTSETKTMYVNSETVNVRKSASKTSNIITQVAINTEVTVISTEDDWYKVEVDGQSGYIASNLLSDTKQETSRSLTTERASSSTSVETEEVSNTSESTTNTSSSISADAVIAYAKQYLGYKYVYGGSSPSGFDCSGFTQYVYKHFGITLNRTAAAQYSNGVSVSSLQPGDLVMFGKSGINHVGIYIGGNSFIHSANKERGVTIDTLASGYYKTNYVGARRIL